MKFNKLFFMYNEKNADIVGIKNINNSVCLQIAQRVVGRHGKRHNSALVYARGMHKVSRIGSNLFGRTTMY